MDFPYGKAPLAILILSVCSGAALLAVSLSEHARAKPDLVYATFTKEHAAAYRQVIGEFEKAHGVNVQIQVVDQQALQSRLQSALQVGANVPDMVELLHGTMGTFTKGPLDEVGFVDLTDRIHRTGLYDKLVSSRFGIWSSRGHIFALPHDLHPMMLAYRKDLVAKLGIDVSKLTTWAEFARVGREVVTKDLSGDGVPDRYMIDLPDEGGEQLVSLLLQHGGHVFDDQGRVAFDSEAAVDVVSWYVKQIQGPKRISFPAGWGQTLARTMLDGLCLFYFCPDWRVEQFKLDVPGLEGKMGLMPLPAWEPGGLRTSTWGGTGLAITKQCKDPDLAWELAMFLYYNPKQLGERYLQTRILPPLKSAWTLPQFDTPSPYFDDMKIGPAYAKLAPQIPAEHANAYTSLAIDKFSEAYTNASLYYKNRGETGLREFTRKELHRTADRVRTVMNRNVFLNPNAEGEAQETRADTRASTLDTPPREARR